MSDRRRFSGREDVALLFWSVVLGLGAAAAFGAYRAVSATDEAVAGRLAEFTMNLLWPGILIFAGVAGAVWVGWKANLD